MDRKYTLVAPSTTYDVIVHQYSKDTRVVVFNPTNRTWIASFALSGPFFPRVWGMNEVKDLLEETAPLPDYIYACQLAFLSLAFQWEILPPSGEIDVSEEMGRIFLNSPSTPSSPRDGDCG